MRGLTSPDQTTVIPGNPSRGQLFDKLVRKQARVFRSTMFPSNATEVIGRRVGNYVVERALAQGGMGSVFVARHPALGREAAVKFIGHDFEAPPELMARFLAEAQITANLRHPNIVDIFDFGELDGRLYYVMELLHGHDLAALLHQYRKFSIPEVLDLLVQVASGLAAAHAVGVVHRDLKPANVFVLEGIPRRVKLMDFGIAKVLSSAGNQTSYGQIMGTPRYMSPEQALGEAAKVSPQSDIYSLGVIAYEMLTGVAPFEHESPVMLLIMHVRDAVRPILEQATDCPRELAELVEVCLSKDPHLRPSSAKEILERLNALRQRSIPAKTPRPSSAEPSDTPRPQTPPIVAPLRIAAPQIGSDDTLQKSPISDADASVLELRNVKARAFVVEAAPLPDATAPLPLIATKVPPEVESAPRAQLNGREDPAVTPWMPPAEPSDARQPDPIAANVTRISEANQPLAIATPNGAESLAATEPERAVHKPVVVLDGSGSPALENVPRVETKDAIPLVDNTDVAPSIGDREAEALAMGLPDAVTNVHGPEGHTATVQLSETDRNVLNKLLMRMQRRGDFPAFVQNVGEVSKRADCESSFSAQQLGASILKDYALTAKLLRIVNSAYANRFGGKIYSIQHAIVILGFDRVRQLALSISLFKTQGNKTHTARITESAINSLVSSEISRELCSDAVLDDPEQAVVCSMFRNLGRHLVLVYLPELYDQILSLMEKERLSLHLASERVLGISMHKLGVGIAERWRLPQRMIQAMAVVPERTGRLFREEDRISALAEFSNQLCEIVSSNLDESTRDNALNALTTKHKHLLRLDSDSMTELLVHVQESFEQRYASVLGPATKTSRFSRNVLHVVEKSGGDVTSAAASPPPDAKAPVAAPRPLQQPPERAQPPAAGILRAAKAKPSVERLQLAKAITTDSLPTAEAKAFEDTLAALQARQASGEPAETLLSVLLKAIVDALNVPRLLAFKATANGRELAVCTGIGEDIDGLTKELRLPLAPSLAATDPFSLAYHVNRVRYVEDCFSPKVTGTMPQRYYEVLGSASLVLIHIPNKSGVPFLLSADLDPPHELPSQERLQTIAPAKEFLAQLLTNVARGLVNQ